MSSPGTPAAPAVLGRMHKLRTYPAIVCSLPEYTGREFWWGDDMEEDVYVRLIREIEVEKGKLSAHERECAERYKRIDDKLFTLGGKLDTVIQQTNQQVIQSDSWKMWALGIIATVLVAMVAWQGGQLYDLQPLRKSEAVSTR